MYIYLVDGSQEPWWQNWGQADGESNSILKIGREEREKSEIWEWCGRLCYNLMFRHEYLYPIVSPYIALLSLFSSQT
jgi:hypothetical protein